MFTFETSSFLVFKFHQLSWIDPIPTLFRVLTIWLWGLQKFSSAAAFRSPLNLNIYIYIYIYMMDWTLPLILTYESQTTLISSYACVSYDISNQLTLTLTLACKWVIRWISWYDWYSFHLFPQYFEMLEMVFVKVLDGFVLFCP